MATKSAPAKKAAAGPAATKTTPAKRATSSTEKAAPAKTAAPVKKAVNGTVTKASPAKSAVKAAATKAAPSQKSVSAQNAAPAKKAAPAQKAVPVQKAVSAQKASGPTHKTAPAQKAVPARKPVTPKDAPVKRAATKAPDADVIAETTPEPPAAPAVAPPRPTTMIATRTRPTPPKQAPEPWSDEELALVRKELLAELSDMRGEYDRSLDELNVLQTGTDGAGDDQADAGSKTFEREQELSIAANRMDLLNQIQRAIERVDSRTYGVCESCGRPIPKARLKAFPMATLDVECKQREERR